MVRFFFIIFLAVFSLYAQENRVYSIQLLTSTDKEAVKKIYENLPDNIKDFSIIYKTERNLSTIRYMIDKKTTPLKRLVRTIDFKKIKKLPGDYSIVNTDPQKAKNLFLKKLFYLKKEGKEKKAKKLFKILKNVFNDIDILKEEKEKEKLPQKVASGKEKSMKTISLKFPDDEPVKKAKTDIKKFEKRAEKKEISFLPEPWMELNIALHDYNKEKLHKILQNYMGMLPHRDEVEALNRLKRYDEALSRAYGYMDKYRYDYLLYKQYNDLLSENSSKVSNTLDYTKRGSLKQITDKIFVKKRVSQTIFVSSGFIFSKNKTLDTSEIKNIPTSEKEAFIRVKKLLHRGYIYAEAGYRKSVENFGTAKIQYFSKCTDKIDTSIKAAIGSKADETLFTLLGGKKNLIGIDFIYRVSNRHNISVYMENAYYYSQDDKKTGSGKKIEIEGLYRLRNSYPDFTFRSYLTSARFSEKSEKGVMKPLSPYSDFKALPESYHEAGIGFLFGYDQKYIYTRRWRPFLSSYLSFNSVTDTGFAIETGMGGPLFRKDNLSFSIGYSQNFQGTAQDYVKTLLYYFYIF
ncbi:hypothetical protein [Nitrosophilus alvini]|uniref:hypothetical protein n=1 Tax=Nitrosophilus alvini TaxID=2714855 RepID=UPI00190AFCD8|nr:hypothetical protein [Nitrosophilus alvini]